MTQTYDPLSAFFQVFFLLDTNVRLSYYPRYQSFGDGFKGLPSFAPFDKILVTAAAPFIPRDLKDQLKIGGSMVIPVGDETTQKMKTVLRIDEEVSEVMDFGKAKFVPMLNERTL